ncbi:MAG: hypothetical protein E6J30_05535 [Chloroflexi bacterium]|nr:MAG: hypothetical protein AUI15_40945 [Actinobacteria bacterium 13_2_20CM_2_66_6]TMC08534.1 MAG: hypothetical protein E6J30_05535 [Chloroflexota bacterium]
MDLDKRALGSRRTDADGRTAERRAEEERHVVAAAREEERRSSQRRIGSRSVAQRRQQLDWRTSVPTAYLE